MAAKPSFSSVQDCIMAIDPQLAPFIARLNEAWPEPVLSLPVDVWRERVERLSAAARTPYPDGLEVETLIIDAQRPVRVRIYRPRAQRALPALVYMHGGGWVIGSIDSHDSITAAIAADTPCVVISVDYARAPEHPFPAAIDDSVSRSAGCSRMRLRSVSTLPPSLSAAIPQAAIWRQR